MKKKNTIKFLGFWGTKVRVVEIKYKQGKNFQKSLEVSLAPLDEKGKEYNPLFLEIPQEFSWGSMVGNFLGAIGCRPGEEFSKEELEEICLGTELDASILAYKKDGIPYCSFLCFFLAGTVPDFEYRWVYGLDYAQEDDGTFMGQLDEMMDQCFGSMKRRRISEKNRY